MKGNEFFKHISDDRMPDIEQVRLNCINQKAEERKKRTRLKFKPAIIIAAMFTAIFMLSAFDKIIEFPSSWQIGTILESLTFGNFEVNKVDEITFTDDVSISSNVGAVKSYRITDPKAYARTQLLGDSLEHVSFGSVEEAIETGGNYLAFTPKGLNYIAENYVFDHLSTVKDAKGNYATHYSIRYKKIEGSERNDGIKSDETNAYYLFLTETYVGEPFKLKVETKNDVEKIILNNGIEALLEKNDAGLIADNECDYMLDWVEDGILYSLWGTFDREEMIKMAESIE